MGTTSSKRALCQNIAGISSSAPTKGARFLNALHYTITCMVIFIVKHLKLKNYVFTGGGGRMHFSNGFW